jgi:steroid 5-alpha reductase family enzyme
VAELVEEAAVVDVAWSPAAVVVAVVVVVVPLSANQILEETLRQVLDRIWTIVEKYRSRLSD